MGIFDSIKKVFKKVTRAVKKLFSSDALGIILFAGAAFFTAGAALGLGGITAGGWSGLVGKAVSSLGLTGSTLGSILGGAATYAGYGAIAGGVTALLTGGDVGSAALQGAALGAIGGGIAGGLGMPGVPGAAPQAGQAGTQGVTGMGAGDAMAGNLPAAGAGQQGAAAAGAMGPPAVPAATGAVSPAPGGGFFDNMFGQGGWLERNGTWFGPTLQGVGGGLVNAMGGAGGGSRGGGGAYDREIESMPMMYQPVRAQ